MKKFIVGVFSMIVLSGCVSIAPQNADGIIPGYTVPAGYKPCRHNFDCGRGEYCGFVGVDTYPVCRR